MNPLDQTHTAPAQTGGIRGGALCLLALFLLAAGARIGHAEPYIAVREGYKCSVCHINMTGGGKRTDFANIYVQTRLAQSFLRWESPGGQQDPQEPPPAQSLYHANLNDYFSVGGDIRMTYNQTRTPGETDKESFSLSKALLYLQMNLIPDVALFYADQDLSSAATTREMFMLFQGRGTPWYAKIGRFFLPSGLRLQDDSAYIRAATRFNYGVTDTGFELGMEPGLFSFSLAYTNGAMPDLDKKISAYGYVIGRHGLLGISSSVERVAEDNTRRVANLYGGLRVGRFTGLLEVDQITTTVDQIEQEAALAELNVLLVRGGNLKITYEYLIPDKTRPLNAQDRTSLVYEPFLNQSLQVRIGTRMYAGPDAEASLNRTESFLEMHVIF